MLQIHLCPLTDRKKKQVIMNSRTFNLILCSSTKNIHQFKRTKSFIFSKLNLFKDKNKGKPYCTMYNTAKNQCISICMVKTDAGINEGITEVKRLRISTY